MCEKVAILFHLLLILSFPLNLLGQNEVEEEILSIFETQEDEMSEEIFTSERESLLGQLEKYRKRKININSSEVDILKNLGLLNDFQIFSIKKYVKKSGAILSYSEIEHIPGFTAQVRAKISPLISLGKEEMKKGNFKNILSDLNSRYYKKFIVAEGLESDKSGYNRTKYRFSDEYIMLKYNADYLNRWELNIIAEKDAGEPIVGKNKIPIGDFISASFAIYNKRVWNWEVKKLVIGDLKASFGQGLSLSNSSFLAISNGENGYMKISDPLSIYTSSNEVNYLRGMGATICYKNLSITPILSYRGIDASISNKGGYKTIYKTGKHSSDALIESQNSLKETLLGINIELLEKKIKWGFSFCGYIYNRECDTEIQYYNKYQLYNKFHYNISSDFFTLIGKLRVYGEVGYSSASGLVKDNNGAFAGLIGGNLNWGKNKIALLLRYYSPKYIAPHAGAYSSISQVANQEGITLNIDGTLYKKLYYNSNIQYTLYPYYRYNIKGGSSSLKMMFKFGWSDKSYFTSANNEFYFTISHNTNTKYLDNKSDREINNNGIEKEMILRYKISTRKKITEWMTLFLKGEYNSNKGGAAEVYFKISTLSESLNLNLGATLFNVPTWNGRVYLYEPDLPQTFSVSSLYKKGYIIFGTGSYRFSPHFSISFKLSFNTQIEQDDKNFTQSMWVKCGLRLKL